MNCEPVTARLVIAVWNTPSVLLQDPRAAAEEFVVERAVVLFPEHAGEELGVELAERRFDAGPRIGFDDAGSSVVRVVAGARTTAPPKSRSTRELASVS